LVARDSKLRLGIGKRNPVGFGIEVEERIALVDRRVRFGSNANDLTRELRADGNIHRLNVGVLLRDIATGREIKTSAPTTSAIGPRISRGRRQRLCGAPPVFRFSDAAVDSGPTRSGSGACPGTAAGEVSTWVRAVLGAPASKIVSRLLSLITPRLRRPGRRHHDECQHPARPTVSTLIANLMVAKGQTATSIGMWIAYGLRTHLPIQATSKRSSIL
jgi:hypothetical protein